MKGKGINHVCCDSLKVENDPCADHRHPLREGDPRQHGCVGAKKTGTAKVRVLVQDVLQPLEFCGAGVGGICTLDAFVRSQSFARNDGEGDFQKCFPNVTSS